MTPGIHDIGNEEYHSGPGISKSGLDLISKAPARYKADRDAEDRRSTAAQRIGSAAHALILEPESFGRLYAKSPAIGRRTKAGKAEYAEWQKDHADAEVLTADEWAHIHSMRESVMAHPGARALLGHPGRAELSAYWIDPETGVLCRCRPDYWRDDGILVDLKTTEDASAEEFARSLAKWRYHVQDPFYTDGARQAVDASTRDDAPARPTAFAFVVVEKKPPYLVATYVLDEESRELGRQQYQEDLNTYANCLKADEWPGHSEHIQNIGVPDWYLRKQLERGMA